MGVGRKLTSRILMASVAYSALLSSAFASDWTGAVNQDWYTAGNWSAGVPATGDHAYITTANPYPIIQGGLISTQGLDIGNWSGSSSRLDVNAATLSSQFLSLYSESIMEVHSSSISADNVWVRNSGQIQLHDSTFDVEYRLRASKISAVDDSSITSSSVLIGDDSEATISSLSVSASTLTVTNEIQLLGANGQSRFDSGSVVSSGMGLVGTGYEELEGGPVNASLVVDGIRTRWTVNGDLGVGSAIIEELEAGDDEVIFSGAMTISNGAVVSSQRSLIGALQPSDANNPVVDSDDLVSPEASLRGAVSVAGIGSSWSTGNVLLVGALGSPEALTINWQGLSSESQTFSLFGDGAFNVLNGGRVASQNAAVGYLGNNLHVLNDTENIILNLSAVGAVRVDGNGSIWQNTGDILLGAIDHQNVSNLDTGILTIASTVAAAELQVSGNGEVSTTGNIVVARDAGATGTIFVGAPTGDVPVAPGLIKANEIAFGSGSGQLVFNHTSDEYKFDDTIALGISGAGTISNLSGRTVLSQDSSAFAGVSRISGGQLQVNGTLGGSVEVSAAGSLEGVGNVGTTINGGTIAPGKTGVGSIGTLTINGNYTGSNGLLYVDSVLGSDASATDKLVITGDTSGTTGVVVTNIGGAGAQTVEGIRIIEVSGASQGVFNLLGNYVHEGQQAVVAGAYAYKLYQGGTSTPNDGDWYLRSQLRPVERAPMPPKPLYQPGVPTYEAYPQALLGLNGLNTLQQRVGNRLWAGKGNRVIVEGADAIQPYAAPEEAGVHVDGNGVWGRIEGAHNRVDPRFSTSDTDYQQNVFKLQAGLDGMLTENENGVLLGGLFLQYVHGKTKTNSVHGGGDISTDGYGFGGTLTWYGNEGFYLDAQAQATWYDSDFSSTLANLGLVSGNKGFGYALSLEGGKRFAIDQEWSVTPQAQFVYSKVDFDSFNDAFGAAVSLDRGESLQGRLGITLDHENSWQNANGLMNRTHIYGIANLYYEFMEGTRVDVAGTSFASDKERLWGGLGIGGSYNWDNDKYSIYGEGLVNTSLNSFGDSYSVKGNVGFRVKW